LGTVLDRLDEGRARRLRVRLGKRLWLVSWNRHGDGLWRARLSCPSLVSTLERTATSRAQAIEHAVHALSRLLLVRGQFLARQTQVAPDRDFEPDSSSNSSPDSLSFDDPWT